jgi:hypothetical protein
MDRFLRHAGCLWLLPLVIMTLKSLDEKLACTCTIMFLLYSLHIVVLRILGLCLLLADGYNSRRPRFADYCLTFIMAKDGNFC